MLIKHIRKVHNIMKFKCKTTNLIYNFEFEVDIASMMKHPDYTPVEDEAVEETHKPAAKTPKKQTKVASDEVNINGE